MADIKTLEVVAWSYIPSDAWRDKVLTDDPEKAEIALGFGRELTELTPVAGARAALDALAEAHQAEVARLTRENEGLAKDAARYRWLRECAWFASPLCVLSDPKEVFTRGSALGADCPSLNRLDAAIDAALAGASGAQEGERT